MLFSFFKRKSSADNQPKVLLVAVTAPAGLGRLLRRARAQVTSAASVSSALHLLSARRFDVVFVDGSLPDADKLSAGRRVPVVALVAGDAGGIRALLHGAADYLTTKTLEKDLSGLVGLISRVAFEFEQEKAQPVLVANARCARSLAAITEAMYQRRIVL